MSDSRSDSDCPASHIFNRTIRRSSAMRARFVQRCADPSFRKGVNSAGFAARALLYKRPLSRGNRVEGGTMRKIAWLLGVAVLAGASIVSAKPPAPGGNCPPDVGA